MSKMSFGEIERDIMPFNKEEIAKIISEHLWINPDDVQAYKIMKGKEIEDIFDREIGLIENNKIDESSVEEYAEMSNYYE